jgi:beta-lactamase regulating signal transducer with metallopeptidase domain
MFAVRGLAVALSVFVIVYCALSLAVCLGWKRFSLHAQRSPARRAADLLFAFRMLPLAASLAVTAMFTVPSFLLLEPRSIDEPVGGITLALSLCGALLVLFGVVHTLAAAWRSSRTVAGWLGGAERVESSVPVPVLRIARKLPAMTAAGIFRPKVLLSGAAEFVLTVNELHCALRHEMAHVQRCDNLRKLLLRCVAFPGMAGLEAVWLEATEMSADDAAVSNAGEALDLAAALIKVSRLGPPESHAELTAALVHSRASVMNVRVKRLIAWNESRLVPAPGYSLWYGLGVAIAVATAFSVTYSQLLLRVHTATEWLVR